jgi:alkylated DNA repair protein (DNA oxidative demethylase)
MGGARIMPPGMRHLVGHLPPAEQSELLAEVFRIIELAPLYTPTMPRTGKPLSVRMTNCGPLGWVTDQQGGYRYQPIHPETGRPWPPIPQALLTLWRAVAEHPAQPEACLVNLYQGKAKLGLHQDRDERNFDAPVVSVSLGDEAVFAVGGGKRTDPVERMTLCSGDVVVLGGPARLAFHGIDRIVAGSSALIPGGGRINLTLRRVNP